MFDKVLCVQKQVSMVFLFHKVSAISPRVKNLFKSLQPNIQISAENLGLIWNLVLVIYLSFVDTTDYFSNLGHFQSPIIPKIQKNKSEEEYLKRQHFMG